MKTGNTFIIHTESTEQKNALKAFVKALKMKFEITREKPYDSDFLSKIEQSRRDYKAGKFTRVKKEELQKFLGLE